MGGLRRTRAIEELRNLCGLSNKENGADDTPKKAAVAGVNCGYNTCLIRYLLTAWTTRFVYSFRSRSGGVVTA